MAPEKPDVQITSGGRDRLQPAADLFTKVFADDPAIRYMLVNLTEDERQAYMPTYMKNLMTAAALNDGVFIETGGWESATVLIPPGKKVDNFWTIPRCGLVGTLWTLGLAGVKRMLVEFQPAANKIKKRTLGKRPYWYLFFIGTLKENRGRGQGSALIQYFQKVAKKDNTPIWLESTTKDSVRMYKRNGFQEIDAVIVGKGVADDKGWPKEGGEGVTITSMLWDPEAPSES